MTELKPGMTVYKVYDPLFSALSIESATVERVTDKTIQITSNRGWGYRRRFDRFEPFYISEQEALNAFIKSNEAMRDKLQRSIDAASMRLAVMQAMLNAGNAGKLSANCLNTIG